MVGETRGTKEAPNKLYMWDLQRKDAFIGEPASQLAGRPISQPNLPACQPASLLAWLL